MDEPFYSPDILIGILLLNFTCFVDGFENFDYDDLG
jgi:hypothetical protein